MTGSKTYKTIARFYDLLDLPFEYLRYRPVRRLLWQGLTGRVLDAGVGTGRNIAYYPDKAEMVGIDLSPAMLNRAKARRAGSGRQVDLYQMNICETEFADDDFDVVVSSFLF